MTSFSMLKICLFFLLQKNKTEEIKKRKDRVSQV